MASRCSVPSAELCCPVCRELFKDPVLLPCSHSFCRVCVLVWWRTRRARECPVCRAASPGKDPPRNLVLKNLCEAVSLEADAGAVCRLHAEKLKLYCLDHRAPVCLVCRDSRDHRDHAFAPADEAAALRRSELRECLGRLREKVKLLGEARASCGEAEEGIRAQARDTEVKIREEFGALREFLRTEEEVRVAALKEEEERKRRRMQDRIAVLSGQMSDLESAIDTIEGGLREDDASLLLRVDALTEAAGRPLPEDPKRDAGALIDVARYLGNAGFTAWYKMKEMVTYTPVILNPNTAHRELHLSEGLTSVRCGPPQALSATPERTERHRCVLGSEGFSSGSHSWDVETGDSRVWALGVMAPGAQRAGDVLSALWMVRFCSGTFTAFSPSCPGSVLPPRDRVRRVRVHLDWDRGELSLTDPETNSAIHSFRHAFTDRLYPYINTWGDLPLRILPVRLSVTLTQLVDGY